MGTVKSPMIMPVMNMYVIFNPSTIYVVAIAGKYCFRDDIKARHTPDFTPTERGTGPKIFINEKWGIVLAT